MSEQIHWSIAAALYATYLVLKTWMTVSAHMEKAAGEFNKAMAETRSLTAMLIKAHGFYLMRREDIEELEIDLANTKQDLANVKKDGGKA